MTNNLDELLELLIYYADSIGSKRDHKAGKDMYTCPFCHSGEHGTGSTGAMHIGRGKDGTLLYYCHSCNSGGNIINMYCQHHGITQTRENFSQIIKGLKQDLGLSTVDYQGFKQSYKFRNPVQNEDLTPKTNVDQKDYTKFFNLALQNQGRAIEYLRNVRKIEYAESIAQYFQIGYIPNYAYEWKDNQPSKTTSAIIIPTSQHSYAWRSTTENLKKKSGTVRPLNIEILGNNTKKFIFLVEGEFDLFSILDITNDIQNCEFSAISVNSAGNLPRFLDNQIKANIQKDTTLIIALDNDEKPNLNVEKFIKQGLNIAKKNKIPCIVADVKELYLNQKDSNEALKFNREEFKKALINEVEKAKNLDITQYLADCDKIIDNSKQTQVSTYDWDDVGRIDRAYSFTQNCLRYCKQSNSWYQYDNHLGILRKNLTDRFIDELHRQIKDQLQKELELYKIKDKQNLESDNKTSYAKDFRKEMKSAITEKAFQNTLKGVARHGDTPITLTELDNPTLLNLKDVTLNLITLETHEHTIHDLCTKYVDTELHATLNPEYVAHWNRFISDIMCNDNEMIEFIQRVCGYILEVANKEECFFILYGRTTRNGKSTLLGAISGVLNDYVKTVSSATLSERPTGKEANPEVINLIGAKLITCGELNSETLLNDTLLKSISGNDPQSARNLFSNDILNFKIDGKLFANCNELPPMKNDDLLNSMRIIVIPFDRHFQEHEQNKDLKRLFATPEYKAVILQWILQGYKRYLKYGVKAHLPKKVIRAIEEYHSEANSINAFLNDTTIFERIDRSNYEECVKLDDDGIKKLYPRYIEWCNENGCKPLSSLNFKKQLRKNRLYKKDCQQNGTRYWHCLRSYKLKPSITFTDERNSSNPDRLVAISQRDLERLKK